MVKIYITGKIHDRGIYLLKKQGYQTDSNLTGKDLSNSQLEEVFSEYDGVITMITNTIDAKLLSKASKNLKVISNFAVGYDNIDVDAASKKKIIVCNTPGVASESVAEHTFAMIFALSKQLIKANQFVLDGKYKKWDPNAFLNHQLWGQTIGIIGLGRIGTFVGQIAYGGFRMKILYHDLVRAEDFEMLTEAEHCGLDQILKEADIVTIHLPLTTSTKHLIGRGELKKMKNSAMLINTARGPIVDEEALVLALEEGKIAAAGLDVFEFEPKFSKELADMDNVILTPHMGSATFETREKTSEIAAQNIIDVFEGKEPIGLVKV